MDNTGFSSCATIGTKKICVSALSASKNQFTIPEKKVIPLTGIFITNLSLTVLYNTEHIPIILAKIILIGMPVGS